MMSLSDETTEEFRPLDLTSLDSFEDEQASERQDYAEPELERFRVLYEPKSLTDDEPDLFTLLYDFKQEAQKEDDIFSPIFESSQLKGEDPQTSESETRVLEQDTSGEPAGAADAPLTPGGPESALLKDEHPEAPADGSGFEGYEKGFEKGFEAGHRDGFAKGLEEGQQQGFAQGETQGLEQGEKQGYGLGFEKGEKEAAEKVEQETKDHLDMLIESLQNADRIHEQLIEIHEEKILHLINTMLEKVILNQIKDDDELVKYTILDALKHMIEPEEIVLSVSDEDYEYIEMVKEDFFDQVSSLKNVSVVSDPSVHRGGCRIETRSGDISADPEVKMNAVLDRVKKAMIR